MVALRKESVDRNYIIKITEITPAAVALRKESVDRNTDKRHPEVLELVSLSARRAWIEISLITTLFTAMLRSLSARRAWIEICVGRAAADIHPSLSARRAWIEINKMGRPLMEPLVALRKESVDRNQDTASSRSALRVALRKESVDRN